MDLIIISTGILFGWLAIENFIFRKDKKLLETVTKSNRGDKSEQKLVLEILKMGFSPDTVFHDLYINKHNGHYSQIDVILITPAGLVVFEVKNYKGWIYGSAHLQKWTQVLSYGKQKFQFYNPILQNKNHIAALRNQSDIFQDIPVFSVVVFFGECVLKEINLIPKNTYVIKANRINEVINKIINDNKRIEYKYKGSLIKTLKNAVKYGEFISVQMKHFENIKKQIER